MEKCGLLGRRLGHSYSPAIHGLLAGYEYRLYEKEPEELEEFLKTGDFRGMNVTIPYKKAVIPYCGELSDTARAIGSVNTLVRRPDGVLAGYNTDAFGFERTLSKMGFSVEGRQAMVLGSGGASATVCYVLHRLGAGKVTVISRRGEDNYGNLDRHRDAQLVVNATPVGMYPGNGASPVDLRQFPQCRGVVDLIYNPARTALLLQAQELGIPCVNGLPMLVAQAWGSSQLFTGREGEASAMDRAERALARQMENVVIVGMPGCGKSRAAEALGRALDRPVLDSDQWVEKNAGMSIPEIFQRYGQEEFRRLETQALAELGRQSGAVIATGGGSVLREENYPLLRQNGRIVWLQRDCAKLSRAGRPLSETADLEEMYRLRLPRYQRFADVAVDNNGLWEETVQKLLEVLA